MNENSIIVRGDRHLETELGPEVVLMHLEEGRFFTLSGTARRFWELIEQPVSIGSVTDRLLLEFAVDRQTCLAEVIALCRDLQSRTLIHVAEGAA